MRRSVSLAVLVAALLASATGTPSSASPSPERDDRSSPRVPDRVGVRLVDVPAALIDDPRARHYIIDSLKPGVVVKRRVEVWNKSSTPLHVELYPGAAGIVRGSFIGAAGNARNELTSWIRLGRAGLDIPARSTARSNVTIAVPGDAAPGERYGVVWAQIKGNQGGEGVSLVNRTGIRVYLSVGGNNPPQAQFTVAMMTAARDNARHAVVQAQVHNTGGRALDLTGSLTMSQVSGNLNAGPYPVQLGTTLAPGQKEPVKVIIPDKVEDGPWDVSLTLKSGLLEERHKARITFPSSPGAAQAAPARRIESNALGSALLPLVAALTLLLAVALGVVVSTRRRERQGPA